MNFTVYLPDQLLQALDQHVKAAGESRSFVVREAVQQYLHKFQASQCPPSMVDHMHAGLNSSDKSCRSNSVSELDFDSIRKEMNASMDSRMGEVLTKSPKKRL